MEIFEENTTRCLTGSYTITIITLEGVENTMATGERIRFLRRLRGLTQKMLGIEIGFPEKSADIRIVQYETGVRTPKQEILNFISNVLEVSPNALSVPDIDSDLGFMHTLFALEDIFGVEPSERDEKISLDFTNPRALEPHLADMLHTWIEQYKRVKAGEISKEDYDKWRYNFPAYADIQGYVKVPSQDLSDALTEELKKDSE